MFDGDLWSESYIKTPNWPCPSCANGRLQLIKESVVNEETPSSKEAHSHEAWEPDWIEKRYSAHLNCSDLTCGERAVVVGSVRCNIVYGYDYGGRTTTEVIEKFYPEFIHPSPSLIHLVDETPEKVVEEVYKASALIWTDTSSSANKLRLAAERILTALKVRKTKQVKGKRKNLTLFERIALLGPKHADIADLLHSIRFLGNHGSHERELSVDRRDLLAAFEIMEHVIDTAFSNKAKRVRAAAKAIKKRKGKPPKSRAKTKF